ncbi:FkbM family methyltransferase [Plastoroseomonas arctica]|uniref:FkbM family methyltransferase n=1 Tax=Plastoroseomonas arctica TaxID=1509237 RepID=A0AAF1KP29_9PROT|nr:FkbM family methyltransferase [Plastoroseomonas arctica]MBR0656969.1 FkbM family methyltransferase [Plastoroseomonas arctica]
MHHSSRLRHLIGLGKAIGPLAALRVWGRRAMRQAAPVTARAGGHPIRIRPLDSDPFVASQIFGWKDYQLDAALLAGLHALARRQRAQGHQPLIIDAGANVGYSALYFAAMFPEALVVAIEPDAVTFAELRANAAREPRIHPVHGALWSHENGVNLGGAPGDGSWSRQVADGGSVPSRRLASLVAAVPGGYPLIVKLDIEGAERTVFESDGAVFAQAPCIVIEPHDFMIPGGACLAPLFAALAGRAMDTLIAGENLIFFDSSLVRPPQQPSGPAAALERHVYAASDV